MTSTTPPSARPALSSMALTMASEILVMGPVMPLILPEVKVGLSACRCGFQWGLVASRTFASWN